MSFYKSELIWKVTYNFLRNKNVASKYIKLVSVTDTFRGKATVINLILCIFMIEIIIY